MKRKNIFGLVLAGVLLASSVVYADAFRTENIEVLKDNISIVVNGKKITTEEEPFIYKGRTYVPLRAVSEALGEEVAWDNNERVVYIGQGAEKMVKAEDDNKAEAIKVDLVDFELDIDYGKDLNYELSYEVEGKGYEAELENDLAKTKLKGADALAEFNKLKDIDFKADKNEVAKEILAKLGLKDDYKEFELEVKYADGSVVKFELKK